MAGRKTHKHETCITIVDGEDENYQSFPSTNDYDQSLLESLKSL